MDKRQEAKELLKEYKQEHINKFIDEIGDEKAEELIEQIHTIDFHQITELYNNTKKTIEFKESKIEPLKYLDKAKLTFEQTQRFDELGSDVVKKGQYAVVTMAGGQGTRLGHNGPKGTFKLDVYGKGKYLFEILVDNLKEANQKYGITINWYIMTSKENNSATVEFLEKNNYFGYDKNFVKIFTQSEMPLIDTEGKLLMGKDYKIREASDGNGGTYSSLRRSGCLADMKEKGIKWVFIGSVDNALLKMVDVTLLGMAIDKGVQIASKSVVKANPHERVGVFCKMNGHPKVIEYTELPEKMAEEVDSDGELKYGESHIMCNLYTIDAIEKISKETLMYHSAFKKNAYIDENGKEIIPTEPNSYKFESFIFDAFEFFDDIAILRGKREDDFAPVKNKDGVDSPKTAKELLEKHEYPWEVLPEISDFIIELGNKLDKEIYELKGENIWIAKSATIYPSAYIKGPAIIGENAEVRHCAFIRGKAIVGNNAVVGNSTELKNVILFDNVQVPHYNYVGDSILGYKSHMGAGSITSNVKSDKKLVVIKNKEEKIETGLKKIGAMLGDEVEIGCGSVLNPGTIIGSHTNIYPLSSVRGVIKANSIYKNQNEIVDKK